MASASSSSRATYIPRSYLASLPPDSEISMGALVAEQDRLADEAREAMPFSFDECSYGKGYVGIYLMGFTILLATVKFGDQGECQHAQPACKERRKAAEGGVYAIVLLVTTICPDRRRTQGPALLWGHAGWISADCQIAAAEESVMGAPFPVMLLVELWARRHFRCDCPTSCTQPEPSTSTSGAAHGKRRRCTLNPPQIQPAEDNTENRYNRNFKGEFCRCGRAYDPLVETEGMLCCIGCEDWFHESCLNLRPLPPPPASTEEPPVQPYHQPGQDGPLLSDPTATHQTSENIPSATQETVDEDDDDEAGVLIPSESYDCLICAECVSAHSPLSARAGKVGWMTIVANTSGGMDVLGRVEGAGSQSIAPVAAMPEKGSTTSAETDTGVADIEAVAAVSNKRKLEESTEFEAKRTKLNSARSDLASTGGGKGDVFLAHGERERLKEELEPEAIQSLPFPLDDEEIYEPPKDDNEEETLDQVTARMVDTLPRAQAIDAIHGYQRLKHRLQNMLAGHAVDGRVVSKNDIEAMFADLRGPAH